MIAKGKLALNKGGGVAFDPCSHYSKSPGTILNSFSCPQSGEEQYVLNKTHNALGMRGAPFIFWALHTYQ
ncbi:hypothetical protein CXF72_01485 [Psychromonas sp. MB-3u-54]|nr:hypothetical protein CXF72_01485 [Psychromonas sp. MB-3u-54]